jgi:hypothetical protein
LVIIAVLVGLQRVTLRLLAALTTRRH